MRLIVQICSDDSESAPGSLWALCNDGSVWCMAQYGAAEEWEWVRVRDIPQDPEDRPMGTFPRGRSLDRDRSGSGSG